MENNLTRILFALIGSVALIVLAVAINKMTASEYAFISGDLRNKNTEIDSFRIPATSIRNDIITHDDLLRQGGVINKNQRAASQSVQEHPDVNWLLSRFLISKDKKWLKAAQERFPNHPRVILESSFIADSPNSPYIDKLEQNEPNNALPNFLRAAQYAKRRELKKYVEEVTRGIHKTDFTIHTRERLSDILDMLLENSNSFDMISIFNNLDQNYFEKIGIVTAEFGRSRKLFGDSFESVSVGISLAEKLRKASESGITHALLCDGMEYNLLRSLDPGIEYGNTGITVGERGEYLKKQWKTNADIINNFVKPFLSGNTSRSELLQFFTRIRADGEVAAINWLIHQ